LNKHSRGTKKELGEDGDVEKLLLEQNAEGEWSML
tara:strand:- start:40 stop:144 length:105 start_codon:yes stop_codon:yes gene_type:complete